MPNDRAVGAAIVLHAVSFVPVMLFGAAFMVHDGLSLSRMRGLAGGLGDNRDASARVAGEAEGND